MSIHPLLKQLAGTDRRSIGKSEQVVKQVLANPKLFAIVFDGMLGDDVVLRMRCADAVEKITVQRPDLLHPYKRKLIQRVAKIDQQEVRWHAAQMFSRLTLTPKERRAVIGILQTYLQDQSGIVRTFAMQALADIALQDAGLCPVIVAQIKMLAQTGTPAMKSRGKKLLAQLGSS